MAGREEAEQAAELPSNVEGDVREGLADVRPGGGAAVDGHRGLGRGGVAVVAVLVQVPSADWVTGAGGHD